MKQKILALYNKRSAREKKVFLATAVILIVLFSDRFVVGPVLGNLGSLDKKINEEQRAITQSLQSLQRKEQILAEAKEFDRYSTGSKNSEVEMTELLRDIQTMANESSLSLLYVKPASQKEGEGSKKFFAALEGEGSMEATATFFHRVESSDKLMKIEKFEIQPKSRDSSLARAAMTVSKTVLE